MIKSETVTTEVSSADEVWTMPDFSAENYPYFLGYALLIWIGVRLIAGPYFVWRDECDRGDALEAELAEPEFIKRKWLANYLAKRKALMAESAATMVAIAKLSAIWRTDRGDPEQDTIVNKKLEEYERSQATLRSSIEELSYLPNLYDLGQGLINACDQLRDDHARRNNTRDALKKAQRLRAEFIRALHMR